MASRKPMKYPLTNPFANASVAQSSQTDALTNFELSSMEAPASQLEPFEQLNLNLDIELPIHEYREQIVSAIRDNHCVVLSGATGCGKTTQLPKLIVDDAKKNGEEFNIIITQPRKIAAITNATRVAYEIGCELGTLVGYQVSLHQELDVATTKILYCTTGVLLNKLMRAKSMKMYSHIILDEIHERDIEMDFLLIVIRRFLYRNTTTRLVLMSATMDCQHFGSYFRTNQIIKMNTKRNFTIERRYLNDLSGIRMSEVIVDYVNPKITFEMMNLAADLIFKHVDSDIDNEPSILVFLPGLFEIENFEKTLLEKFDVKQDFKIIVLHSALPPESQKRAFKRDGQPKIILSTNIAENSVTIPEISIVIDFCLTKYLVTSPKSNLASLKLDWTSKTSCEQRAGRTGRVCDGIVYHLIDRSFFDQDMKMFTEPEMKRIPLEQTVLKTKVLTRDSPINFLSDALDPPPKEAIRNSVCVLKQLGAMMRHDDRGKFRSDDGELTFSGRVMASLPCDVYIAKFILLAHTFSVLEEAIIIGAGLCINGSIFRFDYKKRLQQYCSKIKWSQGSGSDLHAIYNVYKCWQRMHKDGHFRTPGTEDGWFKEFNLDRKNMNEVRDLVKDLKFRLEEHRIKTIENLRPIVEENKKSFMLKICAAGAWLPFYYLQTPQSDTFAYQELGNLDVHRTVYFKNVEATYCTLYNDLLKKALVSRGICKSVDEIEKITYEDWQKTKIFVTFKRNDGQISADREIVQLSNSIVPQVYFGMKDKETASILKLEVMDKARMIKYAEQVGFSDSRKVDINASAAESFVNGIHDMEGYITHIEHCGKFFFQPRGGDYEAEHRLLALRIKMYLNGSDTITSEMQLTHDDKVIVRYKDTLQRAIVIKTGKNAKPMFNLIDIGSIVDDIDLSDISRNTKNNSKFSVNQCFDSAPKCFECTLTGVAPSPVCCPTGQWTEEANDFFLNEISQNVQQNGRVLIEIYSVVDDIVSVTVFANSQSVNQKLVEAGYAMSAEEDLLSRSSHNDRRYSMNLSFNSIQTLERSNKREKDRDRKVTLIPPCGMLNQVIELPGPFSPLESSIYGVTDLQRFKIKIDANSVNSIILNGDINSTHSRFYVAANVSENQNEGVTLREVVMMENIPGLAEILALVFCQAMRIGCNDDQDSYTVLLAGLGSDEDGAYFAPNDAFIPITVQLTDDDFDKINDLRYAMSQLTFTPPNVDFPELTDRQKYDLQKDIVEMMIGLLQKPRKISQPDNTSRISWDAPDNLEMISRFDTLGDRGVYGMHSYPKLRPVPERKIKEWKLNQETLVKVANSGNAAFDSDEAHCSICKISFNDKKEILSHMKSLKHKALVESRVGSGIR